MKKLLAVLFVLCLVVSSAMAEADVAEVNWADYAAYAEALGGESVKLGDTGLQMLIPDGFTALEAEGLAACYTTADGSIVVSVVSAPAGNDTLESIMADAEANGATVASITVLNGKRALGFNAVIEEKPTLSIVVDTEDGNLTSVSFTFVEDEEGLNRQIAGLMSMSIQPAQ